ncbi:MAG: hypothetical protein AAF992_02160 [Bacteroidota bacterium]
MLVLFGIIFFLSGCGSTVTFYGQRVDEYVSKSSKNYELFPAAIQQRWQLFSINDDLAPFGLVLSENNLFLYFTSNQVGKDRYQYGGKAMQSFWGEYSFNEEGLIEILVMKGGEKTLSGNAGKLERLFERIVINVRTYEITGNTLRLYSSEGVLEFVVPPSRISY